MHEERGAAHKIVRGAPKIILRLPCFKFYPAAEQFGVWIGRFAQKIFVVRADREQRRIYAVYGGGKSDEFVPAEVELYRDGL